MLKGKLRINDSILNYGDVARRKGDILKEGKYCKATVVNGPGGSEGGLPLRFGMRTMNPEVSEIIFYKSVRISSHHLCPLTGCNDPCQFWRKEWYDALYEKLSRSQIRTGSKRKRESEEPESSPLIKGTMILFMLRSCRNGNI